ncbi:glutathione S-transferase [Tothia fuscella]|uniref:Glutathione S-transferase n=1 Tax=Tothia fuscella TaxID=1048955 RepID=A0A9P4TSS8_9PEZI|nr:glutathione S-transferase [Tothia fuscella]
MAEQTPNIDLYTAQTPNGIKISILLEELGILYKAHKVDMTANQQKEPWFLEINPNGRIPALTDTFTDGKSIRLFESGSIMQYLVARYDTEHKLSFPADSRENYEVNNWLFFMNAGVGPMQGQANHFSRYAPEQIEYGISRYQNETRRLYGVLDKHLADGNKEYLVGNKCTIADIAHWGWVAAAGWAGIDIEEFPVLKAWEERMLARPGVEKGRHVPSKHNMKELIANKEEGDKLAAKSREWIQAEMKKDAQK